MRGWVRKVEGEMGVRVESGQIPSPVKCVLVVSVASLS